MCTTQSIIHSAPTLVNASFNFSASSLPMSDLITVGALSTNFLA